MYDVPDKELIEKVAEHLKTVIKAPSWASFVKTGAHKERTPDNPDWWYIRAASVLKSVHKLGPVGVAKLRVKYGGKKNRGMKPGRFVRGSGNILRKILQQLEKANLIKQDKRGNHKGRVITPKGESLLFKTAKQIKKHAPKTEEKKEVKHEEKKAEVKVEEKKEEKKAEKKEEKKEELKEEKP